MKRPDLSHSTDCDDNERLEQYQSAWPTWPLELCIRFGALSLKVSVWLIPMYQYPWPVEGSGSYGVLYVEERVLRR